MTDNKPMTVLGQDAIDAVRLMLSKLGDHEVTQVSHIVGGDGPIGDLAAEAMKDRNIDL